MFLLLNKGTRRAKPLLAGRLFTIFFAILSIQSVFHPETEVHARSISHSHWAGYEAIGKLGTYTEVQVSFTILSIPPKRGSYLAQWAGLGGHRLSQASLGKDGKTPLPSVIVQAGVESFWDPSLSYQINYVLWEVVGTQSNNRIVSTQPQPMNLQVHIGDQIQVYVTSNANNDGSNHFQITDSTTGQTASFFDHDLNTLSDGATAECIVENPGSTRLLLANFGTTTLTGCNTLSHNQTRMAPIGSFPTNHIDMVTIDDTVLATTSNLSSDRSTFSVTWHHE